MTQTPSLGRVVHVLVASVTNNGSDIAPATIVRVIGSERPDGSWTVGLKVDLDSATPSKWMQVVRLFADEEAARAFDGDAAFWPPRVR